MDSFWFLPAIPLLLQHATFVYVKFIEIIKFSTTDYWLVYKLNLYHVIYSLLYAKTDKYLVGIDI